MFANKLLVHEIIKFTDPDGGGLAGQVHYSCVYLVRVDL